MTGQTQTLSEVVTECFKYVAIKSLDRKNSSMMLAGLHQSTKATISFFIAVPANELNNQQHFASIFSFTVNGGNIYL